MSDSDSEFPKHCPKCQAKVVSGYGMTGGGIGVYVYCENSRCDFFAKVQDAGNIPIGGGSNGNDSSPASEGV